jgi:hypothetical protein
MNPTLASVVRIQKARTALLLDHPFFGTLLFRLGAQARSSIATMATDGVSLYFNPKFVEGLNSAELIGTLAHETMHPALQHHTRRGGRNPRRWNMATALQGLEGEQNVGIATTNGAIRLLHASYSLIPDLLENAELILRAACENTSN